MNSHKRDEYKRKIAEQKQEIAELRVHVERLSLSLKQVKKTEIVQKDYKWIECCTFCGVDIQGDHYEDCLRNVVNETQAQSLQQIKCDAVLEAAHSMYVEMEDLYETNGVINQYSDCEMWLIDHANNLVKDDE